MARFTKSAMLLALSVILGAHKNMHYLRGCQGIEIAESASADTNNKYYARSLKVDFSHQITEKNVLKQEGIHIMTNITLQHQENYIAAFHLS